MLTNQMGGMVITKNAFTKDHFKDGKNVRIDYEIERLISSNSMGEVHACTNHRTKVKRILFPVSSLPSPRRRPGPRFDFQEVTLRGLDPRILFGATEKDPRVEPGGGE